MNIHSRLNSPSTGKSALTRQASWTLFIICFLVYFNTLGNGFINFDDADERILRNPFINSSWTWAHFITAFTQATAGYYDPVYVLSFAIDHSLWGMNPAGFHFGNLLLHAINTILVFQVFYLLTGQITLSWVSALLFAVHPIHVESVSWATSRKDTLSHFFAFAFLLIYLKARLMKGWNYFFCNAAGTILLLLGMMTKPTVVVMPLIALCSDIFLRSRPVPWKRVMAFHGICWGVLILFVVFTFSLTVGHAVRPEIAFSPWTHLTLFSELYAWFIKLILFPIGLSALYLIQAGGSSANGAFLLLLPVLFVLIGYIVMRVRRSIVAEPGDFQYSPGVWGLMVYLVGLFPFTNILPRTIYLADRYEYLASAGFCLMLGLALLRIPRLELGCGLVAAIVLMYSALVMERVPVWKRSSTMWADVNEKRNIPPEQHHRIMARAYAFDGNWAAAVRENDKAGLDQLNDPLALIQAANIYLTAGEDEKAEQLTRMILSRQPDYLPAITRLVTLYIRNKDYDRAESEIKNYRECLTAEERSYFEDLIRYDKEKEYGKASAVYKQLEHSIWSRTNHVEKQDRRHRRPGA